MTISDMTFRKPTVLVVDDDEDIRDIARSTLELSGFLVEEAGDGLDALSYLKDRTPDLVVLDFMLPGMDGITVCSELRKMSGRERIPVLMITGLNDIESIERSFEAGGTDFMTKPINWTILGHRLMYMLRASETFDNLVRSEIKNRALINAIPDAMFQIDRQGKFMDFKAALDIDLLVKPEEVIGRHLSEVLREELAGKVREAMDMALETLEHQTFEYRIAVGSADRYFEARVVICGQNEVLTLMRDITDRKNAENDIRYMAYHDSLTRLPNMILFRDHLAHSLAAAAYSGKLLAVLFLDLDRFKLINDTLGHRIGDLLLQAIAERIISGMRRSDVVAHIGSDNIGDLVARMGGDEFTLLLTDIKKPEDVAKVSYRILEELSKPFLISSQELFITASIGIAIYPLDGEDMDNLIRNADTAMYHAKIRGRNNFQFFDESMNIHIKERLSIENRIKTALSDNEFVLYYQPKYEIGSGRIIGAEALLRWHPADILNIPVEQVISIAGEIGVIVPLGEWIFRSACGQAVSWEKVGLPSCISVNLSVHEFRKSEFVADVKKILGEMGLDPCCINFEITESIIMHDVEATYAILKQLKDIGIKISVDDFGTGYSSISHLRRFPLDALKIAQPLIKDLAINTDTAEIVKAIISLSHSLKLKVVAEGVETEEQLSMLSEQGCDEFQGFLYSPAIPAADVMRLMIEQNILLKKQSGTSKGKRNHG
jgi:diguanylate cyclase (GGDEF)-like protein/PAS domain S-box-containing protein